MRIVHVITRLMRAGSEENTVATCLAQAKAGNDVILVHGKDADLVHWSGLQSMIKLIGFDELVHELNPIQDIRAVRALRAFFETVKPALVHTHQSKAGIVGRLAARLAEVPLIVHGVHILPFIGVSAAKRLLYVMAERAVAGSTSAFINVSSGTRDSCLEFSIGKPEQHFVAHSGMDLARFQSAEWPTSWRQMLAWEAPQQKPPVVLMLAALEERKRQMEFLQEFPQVVRDSPTVRLLLAGEGPMRPAIERRIEELGLAANVRVLGYTPHPEQLIALADLTVLTSAREGLPRVVVQSLAGGRPVVTTFHPGIGEIVTNGRNGIITSADGFREVAGAISDLLEDGPRLRRMQADAASTDLSRWYMDTMCRSIDAVYAQLGAH